MQADPLSSLVQRVDVSRLRAHVARLARGERHSLYSPDRHSKTVEYISAAFAECGLETRQHTFDLRVRRGINIVSHKPGASAEGLRPLLVSAHYDTVPNSPGADDNASGVAALLECARVLSTAQLRRSVEFVAFDMEEKQPPDRVALVGQHRLRQACPEQSRRNRRREERLRRGLQPGDGRLYLRCLDPGPPSRIPIYPSWRL